MLPELRPGLILNMSTNSMFGKLIRLVLARNWDNRHECPNHDAIVVEHAGQLWIGESQPPVARLTPIAQYEKEIKSKFLYRLRVLEVVGATTNEERLAANWWLDNVRNSPYDYFGIWRLLIKAVFGNWFKQAAGWTWANWCSEGVAEAWKKGAKRDPWGKLNPTPLTTWTRYQQGKFRLVGNIVSQQESVKRIFARLAYAAFFVLIALCIVTSGCAVIKVDVHADGNWNGQAYTLFKTLEVPPFVIGGTNQFETMGIYKSGTDIEKAGTLIGTAVKAAGYGGSK